ncbi:hypothetical protein OE88DRAFT_812545 [Heliocybe sulcata]|uniref:Uncharacterized protein n=1 Tax=Heliocybe sulcata TaxID=5364 RepID=A0A5C3MQP2_9AGAM|nr:hypothetical protein OE88DRAFT_812545 [Heliocybe sulcata]
MTSLSPPTPSSSLLRYRPLPSCPSGISLIPLFPSPRSPRSPAPSYTTARDFTPPRPETPRPQASLSALASYIVSRLPELAERARALEREEKALDRTIRGLEGEARLARRSVSRVDSPSAALRSSYEPETPPSLRGRKRRVEGVSCLLLGFCLAGLTSRLVFEALSWNGKSQSRRSSAGSGAGVRFSQPVLLDEDIQVLPLLDPRHGEILMAAMV